MKVKKMVFNQKFISQLKKLPPQIGEKVLEKLHIFEENPFHPSLRLHKLSGKLESFRSISINRSVRVIFEADDEGTVLLISVGFHDIYEK